MIDTDKYEGHDLAKGRVGSDYNIYDRKGNIIFDADDVGSNMATLNLLADAPLLLAEVKRLRKLEAAVVGSWMETINRGSSWHKQLRYPCVELGYLELRDVERILHVGNGKTITHTSPEFHLKEEYEEMAKQWIKEEYGVEEE